MPKPYIRKTRDCWRFYVNYGFGDGWEHEITEHERAAMKENRRLYRENCAYPLRVVKGRERIDPRAVQLEECLLRAETLGASATIAVKLPDGEWIVGKVRER